MRFKKVVNDIKHIYTFTASLIKHYLRRLKTSYKIVAKMELLRRPFLRYLVSKENRLYLALAFIISILYFSVLRSLFPIPSYYSDSFTWIGAAQTGQPVTMRPIGYSKFLIFFKYFSSSDFALILAQYLSNVAVNLFLFFTCSWLFNLKKLFRNLLFLLLVINPFYVLYSNYVSSDAFFNCFAVLWFTLLIWLIYNPTLLLAIAQLLVLAILFELRYNAMIFPVVSAIAFLLSRLSLPKKAIGILSGFLLIGAIVLYTTHITKSFTGTKTFAAFSGWQLANDALHIIRHDSIDTSTITDTKTKDFYRFAVNYFDTTTRTFPDSTATAYYMWDVYSPLKQYMQVYKGRQKSYFGTWNALGLVYGDFGRTIILKKPVSYLTHFVAPNCYLYFFPPLEIYETYMENRDTIPKVAREYYEYKNKKTPPHHPAVYSFGLSPTKYIFTCINFLFLILTTIYFITGRHKKGSFIFNGTLACFAILFITNFFFVVLLAPSVLRYHIFVLTLSFPLVLLLIQKFVETDVRRKKLNKDLQYK